MRNLSIIIPHYNKNEALLETWKELMLQINPTDEILVIDDHSPVKPDLECPCTEIIQPPKRTPHIYRLNTLRNLGLEHAANDFCIILDPDCVPNPRFIRNARRICDASVLFTGCIDKVQKDGSLKPDGRKNGEKSIWIDYRDKGGSGIWGGCMMFSKSRTSLIDWFDTSYDGVWGAEDADFGARCYHSGMRLRFSMELQVTHQWHEKNTEGYERNRQMWKDKVNGYRDHMNVITNYRPAVGVMVITMLRPDLINQCLQSIFRNRVKLKVRLINNGDEGEETRRICKEWGNRWTVDYINHPRKWPAQVRNDSLNWARENRYKYLVFIDDDVIVLNNGITKLVSIMEQKPDIYAMSGKLRKHDNTSWLLGGPLRNNMFYHLSDRKGVYESDWVGGGFTIHRVKPILYYDAEYETGFNDYDWSMMAKEKGYKLAVTGDAEAYHGVKLTQNGIIRNQNPTDYTKIRYDNERHDRMRKRFEDKWGFYLHGGGVWDK